MMLGINPGLITAYTIIIGHIVPDEMVFNDVLKEPVYSDPNGDGVGEDARVETQVQLTGQLSTAEWERLRMALGGDAPVTEITIIFDYEELFNLGYVDPDTQEMAILRPGDRLISVSDEMGLTIIRFPDDPAERDGRPQLRVQQARPSGFMVSQNLVVATFSQRDRMVR